MPNFFSKIWRKICDAGLWIKKQAKKIAVILGIGGIAIAATITNDLTKNEISFDKISTKYEQATEIKTKYSLNGSALTLSAKEGIKIEIGNNIQISSSTWSDFTPDLKLTKWGDQISFKIKPDLSQVATKDKDLIFEGDKIKFTTPDADYKFYEVADSTTTPEGGYEYEIIFKSKPKTNVVSLNIESYNLEFFYQPALTQAEIDAGNERPENVVGSYAVYHSFLKGNEYKTGKAFHIYRPKIIDANGSSAWGELNIMGSTLTITIPQDFINKGIYPITVDPTIGYDVAGASSATLEGTIDGSYFVFGSSGTTTKLTAYFTPSKVGFTTKCNIYNGIGDTQYTNGQTGVITATTSAGWKDFSFATAPTLTTQDYILACWSNSITGTNVLSYDAGVTNQGHNQSLTYGTWPSPATFTNNTNMYSVYVTYESGGSTIFEDNFNSYNNGNLDGQGNWDDVGTSWQVTSTVVYEGAKSIVEATVHSGDYTIDKTGSAIDTGSTTIYFYFVASGIDPYIIIQSFNGADTNRIWHIAMGLTAKTLKFWSATVSGYVTVGTYATNTWNYMQIESRVSDHTMRMNLNGGTWTAWDTTYNNTTWTAISRIRIDSSDLSAGAIAYFDYIAEDVYTAPSGAVTVPSWRGTMVE